MDAPPLSLTTALDGRYAIQGTLGAGGMARVYLASDLRHGRKVAIKVVRDDVAASMGRERFLNEIRTTASLQHPHILPLLDSGEAGGHLFYVMPFVSGETLRALMDRVGLMAWPNAVEIIRQVAAALDHAHRNGVIHRDIKPENVLLADGLPVVADFGIALALAQASEQRLTQTGTSLGTPFYMSPEQVTGEGELDGRSDQYSVACLLWEMLCGTPPFHGATAQATMVEHVVAAVPALQPPNGPVPAGIDRALRRALAKDPADRFPTVAEFASALGPTTANTPSATIPATASIVVLPFENLSRDEENAFFADGLTEEIITDLSRIGAIRVIARASAMALKGAKRSIPSICSELNVRFALEGSVRRAGNNLRISAQLSDATTDAQVWGEKYSGTMDDVFALQERLSREIVSALRVKLTPDEDRRLASRDITDVRVFECCAMARRDLWRVSAESLHRAKAMVDAGLEQFGRRPSLLATLAAVEWNYMNWGVDRDERHVETAESLAREALAAEPQNAQAHFVLAFIRASRGQIQEAIEHAERAYQREPANPDVLLVLTAANAALGRNNEALRFGRLASEVDPLTPMSRWVTGWAYLVNGDTRAAVTCFEIGERMAPDEKVFGLFTGLAQLYLGDRESARAGFVRASTGEGFFKMLASAFVHGLDGEPGDPMPGLDDATKQWAATDWQYSWHLAEMYAVNGLPEEAMRWLQTAVQRGLVNHPLLAHYDRTLDSLRERSDFRELLHRVKREWERHQVQ
jgi:serine/threonine protein kinase